MSDSSIAQSTSNPLSSRVSKLEELKLQFAQSDLNMATVHQLTETARVEKQSRELLGWLAKDYGSSGKGLLAILSVLLDLDDLQMSRQLVDDAVSSHAMYGDYLFHFAEFLIAEKQYTKACYLMGWLSESRADDYKLHQLYLKTLYRVGEYALHHQCSQAFHDRFPRALEFRLEDIRAHVYRPHLTRHQIHEMKREWVQQVEHLIPEQTRPAPRSTSKLRIALVGDYLHPMFIEPILRHYDSNTIQLEVFTNDKRIDQIWDGQSHALPLDDLPGVAAKMREMQIDIMIEMTARIHELQLMSYRPAPLQGGWIATNITQGFGFSDFVLADEVIIPAAQRDDWSEEIVDLPVWAPFTFYDHVPDVKPCPSLRNGYVTFGACQRAMKFNDETIRLWAEILSRVPQSRLVLKDQSFSDPAVVGVMRERCRKLGIKPEALTLEPGTPHPEYYDYYHQVDISLDTYPYGGGILTAESLWMGVPVITLSGDRFNARLAQTYLEAIGQHGWVTYSPDEYVDKAVQLAQDINTRSEFRDTSRARMKDSPIMQHEDYAQKWSQVMWDLHQSYLDSFSASSG